jgi:CheY-like chemotaxis protein
MPAILLVDADCDSRDMYAEFLRAQGCTMTVAAGGDEALLHLPTGRPDLVTELQNLAIADVVRGAHLSVFAPHPFGF